MNTNYTLRIPSLSIPSDDDFMNEKITLRIPSTPENIVKVWRDDNSRTEKYTDPVPSEDIVKVWRDDRNITFSSSK